MLTAGICLAGAGILLLWGPDVFRYLRDVDLHVPSWLRPDDAKAQHEDAVRRARLDNLVRLSERKRTR